MLSYRGKQLKDMGLDGKELSQAVNEYALVLKTNIYYFIPHEIEMDKLDWWFIRNVERRRKYYERIRNIRLEQKL